MHLSIPRSISQISSPSRPGSRLPARLIVALLVLSGMPHLVTGVGTAHASASAFAIASIRFDAPGRDDRSRSSLNGEVLVVRNRSGSRASLRGWTIHDRGGPSYRFGDVVLGPGESVRLHSGPGRDGSDDVYWGRSSHVWSNTRGRATLRRPGGTAASRCRFGGRDGTVVCLAGSDVGDARALQQVIDRHRGRTTFSLSGRFALAHPIEPGEGDTFMGPATLVGVSGNATGFFVTRRNVRFFRLDMSGFTERAIRCMYGTVVVGGRLHHNGVNGMGCGLQRSPGGGVLIQNVEIDHNGSVRFLAQSSAGIKLAGSPGSVVRDNHVHHNIGNGIWFDVDSGGPDVDLAVGNLVTDNTRRGIYYEVSRGPALFRGNTVKRNNLEGLPLGSGIAVSSSKSVRITNNRLDGNRVYAIRVGQIDRGYGVRDVHVKDNTIRRARIDGCGMGGVTCSGNR